MTDVLPDNEAGIPPDDPTDAGEPPAGLSIELPVGSETVIFGGCHLDGAPTESSEIIVAQLATAIDNLRAPGAVILAGDVFALDRCDHHDPAQAFAAHPRLLTSLQRFAVRQPTNEVIVLAGRADAALNETIPRRRLVDEYGFKLASSVGVSINTGTGARRVRVEHRGSPSTRAGEPGEPGGSDGSPGWLVGSDQLADPVEPSRFVRSRLFYRRFLGPVGMTAGLLAAVAVGVITALEHAEVHLIALGLLVIAAVTVVGTERFIELTTTRWARLLPPGLGEPNQRALVIAQDQGAGDWHGRIAAGDPHPELVELEAGRFAVGCGACDEVTVESRARWGLPSVFGTARQVSWVELEGAADLQVRLVVGRTPTRDARLLESLLRRSSPAESHEPTTVGALPAAPGRGLPPVWPPQPDVDASATLRVRRRAAAGLALAGALNLGSALTPPSGGRVDALIRWVPLTAEQTATALTVLSGIALLLLAGGVRRGQRRAWGAAVVLLAASGGLHVLKGLDAEEAAVALGLVTYLLVHRVRFNAHVDERATRRALGLLVMVVAASIGLGIVVTHLSDGPAGRLGLGTVVAAVLGRLVGVTSIGLGRLDRILNPGLAAVGFGALLAACWLVLRPRPAGSGVAARDRERGRAVVARHGADTLSYFALRDDKQLWFWGESLVAYAVRFGVCLVSPDPIGPVAERGSVWAAFEGFAHDNGWTIAVMGASAEWLPTYRASGMRDVYIGDEAIVDATAFTLEGGHNKSLRHGVNRVRKRGYRMEFCDPAGLSPATRAELVELMCHTRRGDEERGFSMTLGRAFDPADAGLLLAICRNAEDRPVAFCQYTPAPGINGYSLDLMRRDPTDRTNGLLEYVIVETIAHLGTIGATGLGLNFATMRAVVTGEVPDGLWARVQRLALTHLGESMQIESLSRYNAKFDPNWIPRYACFESLEHLLPAALAVAAAESWWELPVIGRFLRPGRSGR